MTNRRKFLLQSSLAATGIMVAKPIETLARQSSSWSGIGFNYNSITFLHTAASSGRVASQVKKAASSRANVVLLHAGNLAGENQPVNFDAATDSLHENFEGQYKIIYRDHIKIGVIAARTGDPNPEYGIHKLAAYLKEEKKCQLVICLSQLGYQQKNKPDDLTLSEQSSHIDIILGKRTNHTPARPVIAKNKNRAEVILQYTDDQEAVLGKIRIGFTPGGSKHHISFK